jgi:hypothetical protein
MQTIEIDNSSGVVSIDAVWQAAYQRGLRDALDEMAKIARSARQPRGEASVDEARRRLDVDLAMPRAL